MLLHAFLDHHALWSIRANAQPIFMPIEAHLEADGLSLVKAYTRRRPAVNGEARQDLLNSLQQHMPRPDTQAQGYCRDRQSSGAKAGVPEAIEARGAALRYLPKYSPDLNPIEMSFSKLKADLRKAAERAILRLGRRVGSFARSLTAREASHYFRHAAYA
jgi:hypothetical protein